MVLFSFVCHRAIFDAQRIMAIFSRSCYTISMLVVLGYVLLSIGAQYPTRTFAALDQACDGNKYFAGSEFERNLKRVLYYLANNGSNFGFYTFQYGRSPNRVFGLLQCRGDTTPAECRNCSQNAGIEIRETCPEATGAIVWYDQCFLRYQSKNFILGITSESYVGFICDNLVAPNPEAYRSAIKDLMQSLATKASVRSSRGFAFGQINADPFNQTIYGIVQCLQLSSVNCSKCVSDAISRTPKTCFTKSGGEVLSSSCRIRFGRDKFYDPQFSSQQITSVQKPSSYSKEKTPRKMTLKLVIILAVLGVALLGSVIWLLKFTTGSKMNEAPFLKTVTDDEEEAHENTGHAFSQQERIFFKLKTLKLATRNFEEQNKIGEGGFGPVYKGILEDGREIAVKKLSVKSKQGKTEFMNEVKIVAKIQHRNLVKLLGCCASGMEKLLVYEYMPNNSLDKILFDPERCRILDWQKRFNIILGVARGLLYLHEDSQPRIIHRDIKAGNILLDQNLNPKISDFGMARLIRGDNTQLKTRIAGTYGYMAPEYAMMGQLSVKVDVFSFGVLILEILSGRKNTDLNLPREMQILLQWAWGLYSRGQALDIMDSTLGDLMCPEEQVLRCIHIGLLCAQADPTARPPMSSIFLMLSSNSIALPTPTIPGFVRVTQTEESLAFNRKAAAGLSRTSAASSSTSSHSPLVPSSRNDVSITQVEGR